MHRALHPVCRQHRAKGARARGTSGLEELDELTVLAKPEVAQVERQINVKPRIKRLVDHHDPGQPARHLVQRVAMRVIPERPRILRHEVIAEPPPRWHGVLRKIGHAVHPDRHAHAVPVDRRRLVQPVDQIGDEPLTLRHVDHRWRCIGGIAEHLFRNAASHRKPGGLRGHRQVCGPQRTRINPKRSGGRDSGRACQKAASFHADILPVHSLAATLAIKMSKTIGNRRAEARRHSAIPFSRRLPSSNVCTLWRGA